MHACMHMHTYILYMHAYIATYVPTRLHMQYSSGTLKFCPNLDCISSLYLRIYSRICTVIVGCYYDVGIMFCAL